jgi:hypothetical protein
METPRDPLRDPAPRDPARPAVSPVFTRALKLYGIYVLAFVIGGGFGAGIPAWLFEAVTRQSMEEGSNFTLYAIMFGVTGWIAYRLAQRVMEGPDRR